MTTTTSARRSVRSRILIEDVEEIAIPVPRIPTQMVERTDVSQVLTIQQPVPFPHTTTQVVERPYPASQLQTVDVPMPQVMTQEVSSQVPVPVMKPVDVPVLTPVVSEERVFEVLSHRSWTDQFPCARR